MGITMAFPRLTVDNPRDRILAYTRNNTVMQVTVDAARPRSCRASSC